jgi:O-antigen/teichoic acid export membrane protein
MKKALFDSFIWRGVYFITTLILNVCIARIFEASESGWIYFISNNFFLVLLISGLSLDSSMTYFSASKRITDNKLALFSLSWPLVVVIVTVASIFFLHNNHYLASSYTFILVAGCAYTFGISLTNFFTSLFYAKHNYSIPNIWLSAINILVVATMFLFAKRFIDVDKQQLLYIYFGQFVLQGAGLAILYLSLYVKLPSLQYPNKEECRLLFRFALIALSANIAYYLIYRIDYLFVQMFCSRKALGNYVQVSKMGQLLLIIPTIISSAVYPQSAMGGKGNVVQLIFRMMTVFFVLYIFIGISSVLFANNIFIWMFGATFNEMYVPFLILLPGILFLSIHIIIAAYFGGNNKPFYNLISTGAGLIIVLIGDLLLIKRMGITAAALVSSLGYFTAFIVSLTFFVKKTRTNWRHIFSTDMLRPKTYLSIFNPQTANNH